MLRLLFTVLIAGATSLAVPAATPPTLAPSDAERDVDRVAEVIGAQWAINQRPAGPVPATGPAQADADG